MDDATPVSLVVVLGAAVLAPVLAELVKRYRIPSVLFELLLGILIGPAVLGWAEATPLVEALSQFGLAFLFFMAGYEIEFAKVRGTPLNRGIVGWGVSLALGFGVAAIMVLEGFALSDLLIGLALTTTAIGTLLPMIRDRGIGDTGFGRVLLGAGAVGEFGPVLAITVLLSQESPLHEIVLLVGFVGLTVLVAYAATLPQPPALVEVVQRHLRTTSQLPVRLVVFMLAGMVLVAFELGLDTLLGAFAAGMVTRLALSPEEAEGLEPKVEALGYGFLIPIFFVVSGMDFDLASLGDPATLVRVPLFFVLFLVVRGLPALVVYRGVLQARERTALALLQATALPLVVVITGIGVAEGEMLASNAAALVGAAMLSVLVFPLVGFGVLGTPAGAAPAAQDIDPAAAP